MPPVLLLDIDGTLLDGHGVGRRSVEHVLGRLLGRPIDTSSVSFSGKTDPQILRELLADPNLAGPVDDLDDAHAAAVAAYADDMHTRLAEDRVTALPGAVDLVQRLHAEGVPTGLLTGNLEPLAYLKLGRIGLDAPLFPFGAFGSDHEDRNALPAIAARRAGQVLGRDLDASDLVVVGDTPRDIACARHGGCRVVAVATGRYSAAGLADADVVLRSLDELDLNAL